MNQDANWWESVLPPMMGQQVESTAEKWTEQRVQDGRTHESWNQATEDTRQQVKNLVAEVFYAHGLVMADLFASTDQRS